MSWTVEYEDAHERRDPTSVPDGELRALVRDFRTSVATDLEAQHRRIADLNDEVRKRIGTAETAILSEIRDLSSRLDRRLERVESRMETIEGRLSDR